VAEWSETIYLDKFAPGFRTHPQLADSYVAKSPDRVALLLEDGASWTYRELDRRSKRSPLVLGSLGGA